MLSDVGGALDAALEACVSLIRVKVDARGDAGGLWCHASDLHPQQRGWSWIADSKEYRWVSEDLNASHKFVRI
jgi:hypothetical protein